MKLLVPTALLGAAGFLALSLSAHAAGVTALTEQAQLKPTTATPYIQLARDENPGGGMYKKSKKKKKSTG